MSDTLAEYAPVIASDIVRYREGQMVQDFLDPKMMTPEADWIITNPPFGDRTLQFVFRGLELAHVGIAMFVRSQWAIEGIKRYERIFRDHPPTCFAPFVERVPLCKARWDPDGSTATAYSWLVWVHGREQMPPFDIPPGCRKALTRSSDRRRFAPWSLPHQSDDGDGPRILMALGSGQRHE